MANWEFDNIKPSSVRVGITQRDQFDNDEVGLAEALVREVIQNSSDAAASDAVVKVRFQIKSITGELSRSLADKVGDLSQHLETCNIDCSVIQNNSRLLCIEDFHTTGLTGSFEEIDSRDFDNFWRAHGDSTKQGKAGGRWGLGKLVFSSSSYLHMFYGLTIRDGDQSPALMGQAVLQNHRIGDEFYTAHGFWCDGSIGNLKLQQPFQSTNEIDWFGKLSDSFRSSQPGLSIAIPFLKDSITEEEILFHSARNYFFPILAGRLEVEVGERTLSSSNFLSAVRDIERFNQVPVPFEFVSEVGQRINSDPHATLNHHLNDKDIDENSFNPETLVTLKSAYLSGDVIHVRVPLSVVKTTGNSKDSWVDIFLATCPEQEAPYTLYSRGPIVLTGEMSNFRGYNAHGALVAMDEPIADLLGDAENPAHTSWNLSAEKLQKNWKNDPSEVVRRVRRALKSLFILVAEQEERKNETILLDFFSVADKAAKSAGKKRKTKTPDLVIPAHEKAIHIGKSENGFELKADTGALEWEYPRRIRIKVAYDVQQGNPFKLHSPFDFDFAGKGISYEVNNADLEVQNSNIIVMIAENDQFCFRADGFDPNRDLIIEARAQS